MEGSGAFSGPSWGPLGPVLEASWDLGGRPSGAPPELLCGIWGAVKNNRASTLKQCTFKKEWGYLCLLGLSAGSLGCPWSLLG
eukprot:7503499-Pyramimonas_sp.AAC.1